MTIDRKVGLALVLAILIEAAGVFLWVGQAGARIDDLERQIARQQPVAERLARLEVRADDARAALERIERRLDGQRRP